MSLENGSRAHFLNVEGGVEEPVPPTIDVTVDGRVVEGHEGELLIEVINRETGKELAQVCYLPQLGPIQTCDTCMVEVNGRLQRACGTRVERGMRVETESARAQAAQCEAFDRILGNHLLYCTVCDNNNQNCTVHNTTALLKVEHQAIPYRQKPYEKDETNPFYRYDPDQCILCGRCVEACQNVQVNETLSIRWEDDHPRVLWDGGSTIGESSCVSCGHCVTVCPCNALMEKSMLGEAGYLTHLPRTTLEDMIDLVKGIEPELGYGPILQVSQAEADMRMVRTEKTKTVCTYCGVGCSFDVWHRDRQILKIEPHDGPANGISTCVKGKFGFNFVNSGDRLTSPLIRDGEKFRQCTWDEALDFVAEKMKAIRAEHGPDALEFIASSKCTNEESYLMQKLARAVIGTNNVDNCSRYCQSPATKGLSRTVGYGGDSGSISDMERADVVVIVGANAAENHPVLATRVKRAHKLRGQKLIVADLRKNEMAARADIWLQPKPGTDTIWLNAVAKYILDHGWHDEAFIAARVNNFDKYAESLLPFTMEFAEQRCGIAAETLRIVAEQIGTQEKVCILWAMGVTQHKHGSDTSTAISNLLLLTGNYGKPGTGGYPLRGHNNVQGCSDFGSMPDKYPGYMDASDPKVREHWGLAWGAQLPESKGMDNHIMVDGMHEGKIKALYLIGEDMISSESNKHYLAAGLERLELFVVQELFFTLTCQYADVILPGTPSFEKEGTYVNTERRIQRLYEVMKPLPGTRPDWMVIQDIANRLGSNWNYHSPSDVMDECAGIAPLFAGVTYARLAGYNSLQWPVQADGTDTPLLYIDKFPFPDGKAKFHPIEWAEPSQVEDSEYDLHLNNGRMLEHFEAGNMTYRVPGIVMKAPDAFLEVSPELAKERGLESGRWVKVKSRDGEIQLRVLVTDRVSGNQLYAPLNSRGQPINTLTSNNVDVAVHTPAYKETPVQIEPLPLKGRPPLPHTNHRFHTGTPQNGVEVERKWARRDYRLPGENLVQIETAASGNGRKAGKA
ncbi:MAG: formate dehydrogenase subunit alpha [Acidobacteriaceae bacterium]